MLEKVSPSVVFVFYLGNSVALTLVALIVLTVYGQQPGLSTSFLPKSKNNLWHFCNTLAKKMPGEPTRTRAHP